MNDLDPYENCPYDPVHRILRSRMQFHLTRCAKNYPEATKIKKTCPYDTRHVVNNVEYQYHVNNCPARESVWRYKIDTEDDAVTKNLVPIDTTSAPFNDPCEENWDDEAPVQTYNPLKHIQDKPVVYSLIGASKAKRKAFRKEQRLRYLRVTEQASCSSAIPNQNTNHAASSEWVCDPSDKSTEWEEEEDKPLRRPKQVTTDDLNISQLSIKEPNEISKERNITSVSNVKNTCAWSNQSCSLEKSTGNFSKFQDTKTSDEKRKVDQVKGSNETVEMQVPTSKNANKLNFTRLTKNSRDEPFLDGCKVDPKINEPCQSKNPWNPKLNYAKAANPNSHGNAIVQAQQQTSENGFPTLVSGSDRTESQSYTGPSYAKMVDKNLSKNLNSDVRELIDSSKENILNSSILKEELKNVIQDVKASVEEFDREKEKITRVKQELLKQKKELEQGSNFVKIGKKGRIAANFKN